MLLNATSLRSLYTGFSTAFQSGFTGVESQYQSIATVVPSSTRSNEYGWLGQMPRVREWLGERQVQNISTSGYTIKNRKFESTISVDADDVADDNIGIYAPLFQEFGRSAAAFPDELVFALLLAGFSTLCYDGQYYFDVDHPVLDANGQAQSVSNFGGGTGTPWFLMDTSRPLKPMIYQERKPFSNLIKKDKPDDDEVFNENMLVYGLDGRCNAGFGFWQMAYGSKQPLDATHYEQARVALSTMTGDYGRPLGIKPNLLVCGPTMEGSAREVLMKALVNGGETNKWAGTAQVMVVPWLP